MDKRKRTIRKLMPVSLYDNTNLEPCDQYRAEYEKEMEGQYLLAGWEAVGDVWHKFYIFSASKDGTQKPELSAEIRNAGESSLKKTGHGSLLTCAVDVVLVAFWCYTILGRFGFWYTMTQATPFLLCVLMAFMLGINILWRMSDYIQIRRYLKGRKAGNGEKYAGRWRAKSIRFAIIFLCFCLVLIWDGERNSWHKELNALSTDLPVPPM